jgi:hypothetical protein
MLGEIGSLGETMPKRHFGHYKLHMIWTGVEPGLTRWSVASLNGMIQNNGSQSGLHCPPGGGGIT